MKAIYCGLALGNVAEGARDRFISSIRKGIEVVTWNDVCDRWDMGETTEYAAQYDGGIMTVRPLRLDSFEYKLSGCRTQADRDWREADRWWQLAKSNGDFVGMKFIVAAGELV